MAVADARTAYRTCPLCEATCGLELSFEGERLTGIRGDADDVFSHGFICPKGSALRALHEDPDRLTTPLIREGDGFREASWDEAFALIAERLAPILAEDRNGVGVYLGNPNAHNLSNLLYTRVLNRALSTRNVYSASTVDQFPKQMASALMFGTGTSVAVPDVDRTDHLLILGANPLASNGSLMTAPDMRGRLRAIRARGGKIVVIDPRRTRTAQEADEHHFIRPGTDALFLFALVAVLFEEDLADPGERIAGALHRPRRGPGARRAVHARGASPRPVASPPIRSAAWRASSPPPRRPPSTAGSAPAHRSSGRWPVGSSMSSTCSPATSTPPGAPCSPSPRPVPRTPAGEPGRGRGARFGRFASRVRGLGELFGELPVVCLAEEIDTPGEGRIRALITVSGNPVLSTPNSDRLDAALREIDFMVSLDVYVNETTRHADVILPAPSPLRRGHYDLALYQFAVRNVANYSPPVLDPEPELPDEWLTLLRLSGIAFGMGPDADLAAIDDGVARTLVQRELDTPGSPVAGRTADEIMAALEPRVGPERLLDLMLRAGPYGDGFGARTDGPQLTLAALGGRAPRGRPRPAGAPAARRAADRLGHDRARPGTARLRCPAAARRAGPRRRRAGADRPPPPALQQFVDAQPSRAGQGQAPLHAARAPR